MAETLTAPKNPYNATLVDMPAEAVDRLMKARAGDLDWFRRTIRNAIRGAARQDRTLYVGRTATGAHITADPSTLPIVDYAALADGTVVRYQDGGSAYSAR